MPVKSSILYSIILLPIFIIFIVALSIFSVSYENINAIKNISSDTIKENFMNNNRDISFNDVYTLNNAILYDEANISEALEHELENKLDLARDIVDNIYQSNKHDYSIKEIQKKVITQLSLLKFDVEHNGHYFVLNSKKDLVMSHPNKEYIGVNFSINNEKFKELIQLLRLKEGIKNKKYFYDTFYFPQNSHDINYQQIQMGVFEYKPLHLLVGTSEFTKIMQNKYKNLYINKIQTLNSKKEMNKI